MTGDSFIVRAVRFAAAAVGCTALGLFSLMMLIVSGFEFRSFADFFTALSSVLAVVTLMACAVSAEPDSQGFTWMRGVATACMVVTGLVQTGLLSQLDGQVRVFLIVKVMYVTLPILMVLDWLLVPGIRTRWTR